jgi:hypothetical protein
MAGDEDHRGWSAARFSCPVCKQPVQAIATKRRKVFGTYVPVWEPGECQNPDCPLNTEPLSQPRKPGEGDVWTRTHPR